MSLTPSQVEDFTAAFFTNHRLPVAGMAAGAVPSLALRRRFELIAKTRGVEIPS